MNKQINPAMKEALRLARTSPEWMVQIKAESGQNAEGMHKTYLAWGELNLRLQDSIAVGGFPDHYQLCDDETAAYEQVVDLAEKL